jgi:hypothetical protein
LHSWRELIDGEARIFDDLARQTALDVCACMDRNDGAARRVVPVLHDMAAATPDSDHLEAGFPEGPHHNVAANRRQAASSRSDCYALDLGRDIGRHRLASGQAVLYDQLDRLACVRQRLCAGIALGADLGQRGHGYDETTSSDGSRMMV